MNRSQAYTLESLLFLVNFKRGVLIKKKTLQEPILVQVDLNRGIKEGFILLWLLKKLMKMESEIHNTGFLISPTTHLFPLSSQSGSRGVSIKITLEYEIHNVPKDTTLYIRATLVWKDMNKKLKKWHRRKSPHGGWWKSLFKRTFYFY